MGTEKVYCQNCKYLFNMRGEETEYDDGDFLCEHPNAKGYYDTWYSQEEGREYPTEKNKKNDCPDYRYTS